MTDDEIDYTYSPEATEEMFALMAARKPEKVKVNLRTFTKSHINKNSA